jgi:hypothetical protein
MLADAVASDELMPPAAFFFIGSHYLVQAVVLSIWLSWLFARKSTQHVILTQ